MGISGPSPMGITVAAADAPGWMRTHSKVVCKGTSDADVFANLLDDSSVTGLQLSGGRFLIDATTQVTNGGILAVTRNNVVIAGAGWDTILDFETGQGFPDRYMLAALGSSNHALTGWEFKDLRIRCHDAQHHGIRVTGSGGGKITNVRIEHDEAGAASNDEGIQYTSLAGGNRGDVLDGLRIEGFGGSAIEFAAGDNGVEDVALINSIFASNGTGVRLRAGTTLVPERLLLGNLLAIGSSAANYILGGGENVVLNKVVSRDAGSFGFSFSGTTGDIRRFRFFGCVAEKSNRSGYDIDGDQSVFVNCVAKNNGQDSTQSASNRSGFRATSTATNNVFIACDAYDDQSTTTQQLGFQEVSNPSSQAYIGCNAEGNSTNWQLGTAYDKKRTGSNRGFVNENYGATSSIGDGDTITHGLSGTPVIATVSGTVAGQIVTVTSLSSVAITVAVKGNDGAAGSSQAVYWNARL